jgi:hypothetical protein
MKTHTITLIAVIAVIAVNHFAGARCPLRFLPLTLPGPTLLR